ncbi:MAG: TSUP family transporter [Roseburia sp.]
MVYLIFFLICFFASVVGAICGIGGGVIIKPVLDAFGVMDVAAISFLSGCTVLSMTTYSVVKSKLDGESHVEKTTGVPLAVGSAFGGLAGKWMFSFVASLSPDKDRVGAVQAVCLMIITIGTLIYTLYKERIKTYEVQSVTACLIIGLFLGILSSFLGIGGGPINLVILFFFFSMTTKTAAENSLYIIFFSQIASLISSLVTASVPEFPAGVLVLMVIGGIVGGICGRALNQKIEEKTVDRLFIGLMVLIMLINIYNIYNFLK